MPMPLAITLRFDPDSGFLFEEMWRALAAAGIGAGRHQIGYTAHNALPSYPDETSVEWLRSGLARVPGAHGPVPSRALRCSPTPSILWAALHRVCAAGYIQYSRAHSAEQPWTLPTPMHYRALKLAEVCRSPGAYLRRLRFVFWNETGLSYAFKNT